MKHITSTFLKGLFTLLPLLLSLYVFIWFLTAVESNARRFMLVFWPEFLYIPGLGTLLVFALIYATGVVVDRPFARWAIKAVENLFSELPLIKTVYLAIKDFTNYLKPGKKTNQGVVLVRFPGQQIEMIGLMTRDNLNDLPAPINKQERVAVYFPMSYQFGGCTLFIPRAWITPTNMTVEAAMRSIITAWLPGEDAKLEGEGL